MKQQVKDYFTFSKKERRGIFVLLVIIFLIIVVYIILPYLKKDQIVDFTGFEKDIEAFEESQRKSDSIKKVAQNKPYSSLKTSELTAEQKITPFEFNPNNLPPKKWKELGLTDKQIIIIKNYESKGGKFYKKEDLKKIYSISEDVFKILEPFIIIPEDSKRKDNIVEFSKEKAEITMVELNSADETVLVQLKGIGPSFSKRIIKYRNMLGGFYKKEQLLEVYGMDKTRYNGFIASVEINPDLVKKINLNTATFKTILKHPYFDYNTTKLLIEYRAKQEQIISLDDLKEVMEINDSLYNKISPYLKIQ